MIRFNKGDYIQFGKYYDEPILWQCIDKDKNGSLLVSVYIICLKAFDVAESGKAGKGNSDEEKWGSNKWYNSNIREWLNSDEEFVCYSTQAPVESAIYGTSGNDVDEPTTESIAKGGYNAYADEAGFLTNFDQEEKEKINLVKHRDVVDKVFLLSQEELRRFWKSDNERIKYPTNRAVENSDYKEQDLKVDKGYRYWTRSDSTRDSGHLVIYVNFVGDVNDFCNNHAYYGDFGVMPALYLKSDTCKSGKGTKIDPYVVC